ncbi:MAG: cobalamin-binding protein [Chloroflexi bacterium]|nr:cobalamin-binding protein [Chloroflexota bacterium]
MKERINHLLYLAVTLGLICCAACATPSPPTETKPPPSPPVEIQVPQDKPEPPPEELPQFPLTVVDDLGRKVQIAQLPQRIVSLAPSNTEILYALGLEDKLVGTTDYCDYPEAAKSKPRVASYTTPNLEKVVSVQPDLILAEAIHEKTALPAMENLGLTVIVTSAKSLDTVLNDIKLVGQVNGKSKAAERLVDSLTERIQAVVSKTATLTPEQRLRVLYVVWHDPIWTMGRETFINDLIWKAGGINVFAADFEKSRVVSLEAIIQKDPQVIIVSGMGTTGDLIYNNIKKETRLADVDAMRNNRVFKISDANLIERPGPRIADGLEEVARLLHPEIFGTSK